jgi:hypothetical protein
VANSPEVQRALTPDEYANLLLQRMSLDEQLGQLIIVQFAGQSATPEALLRGLRDFMDETIVRERTQAALAQWHTPDSAERIAETILAEVKPTARTNRAPALPSLEDGGYEPAFQTRSIL